MPKEISAKELVELGLDGSVAGGMAEQVNSLLRSASAVQCWRALSQQVLRPCHPFSVHKFLYEAVFSGWDDQRGPWPAWSPTEESQRATNIWRLMERGGFRTYEDIRRWSCENREQFWALMVEQLSIRFSRRPSCIMDPSSDAACPRWLVDARFNIVDSCFDAPADATAIVYRTKSGATSTWSYGDLLKWTNRVANGLVESGFEPGHAIGVCLPMTAESVAIYLGIVKAGCVAVSIADSYASEGIAARLKLGQAKGIFTQDYDIRGRKPRPLYEKVVRALRRRQWSFPVAIRLLANSGRRTGIGRNCSAITTRSIRWLARRTITPTSCSLPEQPMSRKPSRGRRRRPSSAPQTLTCTTTFGRAMFWLGPPTWVG